MNRIEEVLTARFAGADGSVTEGPRFVFPTETAAFFWARKALSLFNRKTLARERFLAWDRFKEACIKAEKPGLQPSNAAFRKLFAVNLAERNAKQPFLKALIPEKFAADSVIFADSVARILPMLGLWLENFMRSAVPPDDEDRDYLLLEKEYAAFLEKCGLFESAWEKPPFRDSENEYFIFYPELIEDFAEYEKLLSANNVHVIRLDEEAEAKPLYRFEQSRAELRSAILEIRRLHEEEHLPYEDMAISAAGLETIEPYIMRDAELYAVPLHIRSGKMLSEYGAGAFFSLARNCVRNNFSFASLKALLLNRLLPWRAPEKNEALIRFGIKYNCVSSYYDNGKLKDVWEEAFWEAYSDEKSVLQPYYRDLKHKLLNIVNSKSFADVRKHYFAFRGNWDDAESTGFFSKAACSDETYDVSARCIEELSTLMRIQETAGDITVSQALDFFIETLAEKRYVRQTEEGGVNVFEYKLAAAAPFAAHFVLNANQKHASVVYRNLKFLRPDKRKRIGLGEDDYDASPAFFRAYDTAAYIRYSASGLTFSGWTIPHSFFNGNSLPPPPVNGDPYLMEKSWWADTENNFPAALFPLQKKGFAAWKDALRKDGFNMLSAPFNAAAGAGGIINLLRSKITEKKYEAAKLRISATDLQLFYKCPVNWLFENIFEIEEESLEALLLDDKSKGLLFHTILNNLFLRIKNEDKIFTAANIEKYNEWARECGDEAAAEYKAFRGPLCAPLIGSMMKGIMRHISELLEIECGRFDGYSIAELESEYKLEHDDYLLNGRLDKVSVSNEGGPCIVDYKMGVIAKKDCILSEEKKITNFQIPLYIKLYEKKHCRKVEQAVFLSIVKHEASAVVGDKNMDRDGYQPTLDALETYLDDYNRKMGALCFTKDDVSFFVCVECAYKKICRTTFSLNAREGA